MSKMRKRLEKRENRKQIARTVKRRLILLITFLIAIVLVLVFKVGDGLWPEWIIEYRAPIIGFILFILFASIALSPIIIEVSTNARHLSGPGKNPEQGWDP